MLSREKFSTRSAEYTSGMIGSDRTPEAPLGSLEFSIFGYISRPSHEVYEAVADPLLLSKYFTTGGAKGRLEAGAIVEWDFADFPGAFPVEVLEADGGTRIVVRWGGEPHATVAAAHTDVTFEFIAEGERTKVVISERAWQLNEAGSRSAFGNCMGWTGMLAAMKAWLEHGINLREGFYR